MGVQFKVSMKQKTIEFLGEKEAEGDVLGCVELFDQGIPVNFGDVNRFPVIEKQIAPDKNLIFHEF